MRSVPVERIERKIYFIRDQKVMLDSDLAALYEVTTGNLNLAGCSVMAADFRKTLCSS